MRKTIARLVVAGVLVAAGLGVLSGGSASAAVGCFDAGSAVVCYTALDGSGGALVLTSTDGGTTVGVFANYYQETGVFLDPQGGLGADLVTAFCDESRGKYDLLVAVNGNVVVRRHTPVTC